MSRTLCLLLWTTCVATLARRCGATVNCYVCTGYVGEPNDDCAVFKAPSTAVTTTSKTTTDNETTSDSSVEITDILVVGGCTSCVTVKATAGSVTTYTRSCSTASSVPTGCSTVGTVATCTYDCTTDLCNTGDARALRYTLASLLGALILSATL